jgi:protein SCO1/2
VNKLLILSLSIPFLPLSEAAARGPSPADVKIEPKLGNQVPLHTVFRDESDEKIELRDYFRDRPVILVLAYLRCPRLCNEVLNDLNKGLRGVQPLNAGRDFQVVVVSFDAREKPALAAAKKRAYVEDYGRPGSESGWHFLTGDQPDIDALEQAVGFRAVYDPKDDQFAHDSAVIVLTPQGKVSRYLFGLGYTPRDLRLALVESSDGKVGSFLDHVLLLCFHYDPAKGRYSATILTIVRVGGLLTVIALIAFWARVARRSLRTAGNTDTAAE